MQGMSRIWLFWGLIALLFVAAPAVASDIQYGRPLPDPGYPSQAMPGHFVSSNATTTNLEARISALEAAMVEEKDEIEWIDVSNQKWSTKIGGSIFADYVLYPSVDQAIDGLGGDYHQNYFEFRRARLFASGTGYGVYDYKFNIDWESGDATAKDIYVGIHEIPLLGYVRFGHYFGPIGLESQTSSKYTTFMERSLATVAFGSDRQLGVCAFKNSANDTFHVQYGAFLEGFRATQFEVVNDNQGVRVAGRAVWTPIHTANGRGVLHFGASGLYVDLPDDEARFRNRPEVHKNVQWINTDNFAARDYGTLGLELASIYGPFSLQGELFYTKADSPVAGDVSLYGAYAYASYFLTGENRKYDNVGKSFSRVTPHTNFWIVPTCDGHCAGWGAWELAGRWSWVDYTDPALSAVGSAGQLSDLTLGVNWHWNPYTRVMFEWIHPFLNRNDIGAAEADILGMRIQYDF
jgi:phosphate-selective porin OprO and OprP